MSITDTVRAAFAAYLAQDAVAARPLYSEDFRFSSPQDDGLDKDSFFITCFPTASRLRRQDSWSSPPSVGRCVRGVRVRAPRRRDVPQRGVPDRPRGPHHHRAGLLRRSGYAVSQDPTPQFSTLDGVVEGSRGVSSFTYVLVPGEASSTWHWRLLAQQLRVNDHQVMAVDLSGGPRRAAAHAVPDRGRGGVHDPGLVRRLRRNRRLRGSGSHGRRGRHGGSLLVPSSRERHPSRERHLDRKSPVGTTNGSPG